MTKKIVYLIGAAVYKTIAVVFLTAALPFAIVCDTREAMASAFTATAGKMSVKIKPSHE